MIFVVLYFRLSERQQSLTEHENVRGAQRFQTPSYILSPLDSGPQQSLERLISFSPFLPFKAVRRIPPATAVFLLLFFKHNSQFPMVAAYELVECSGGGDFVSGIA